MHRTATMIVMALTGLLFFAALVVQDIRLDQVSGPHERPWSLVLRYALSMTVGGALAGFVFAGLFGRRGLLGWILACLGGVLSALVCGFFGSAIGLLPDLLADGYQASDLIQAAAGILVVPFSLIEQPLLIPLLLGLVILAHVLSRRARNAAT